MLQQSYIRLCLLRIKFFDNCTIIYTFLIINILFFYLAFSRVNNYKIQPTQELIALGITNILNSFVSGFPVTGSFSRTAVNSQSGVKTPLGGKVAFPFEFHDIVISLYISRNFYALCKWSCKLDPVQKFSALYFLVFNKEIYA